MAHQDFVRIRRQGRRGGSHFCLLMDAQAIVKRAPLTRDAAAGELFRLNNALALLNTSFILNNTPTCIKQGPGVPVKPWQVLLHSTSSSTYHCRLTS